MIYAVLNYDLYFLLSLCCLSIIIYNFQCTSYKILNFIPTHFTFFEYYSMLLWIELFPSFLAHSLVLIEFFVCVFLIFYIKIMLSVDTALLLFFFSLDAFYFFSCLITLTRTSRSMLKRSVRVNVFGLVMTLEKKI